MKAHSRYNVARKILVFWCMFIGIGAVWGAICMIIKPDGSILKMQDLLPYFQVLPFADVIFRDYIFSGIALLCVNGITNLIAAVLLIIKKKSGIVCGTVFGFTLMAWITIQFIIFPANFLSTIYFVFGTMQLLTGFASLIFYAQEHFEFNVDNYQNIGTNASRIVVFFSRMGYTRKIAYELANKTGADILEIRSTEHTEGTGGFWWCGRFAMHKWDMPIEEIKADLSSYKHITICSPVWAFFLAAPMRTFCHTAKGKIKHSDYILTHFNRCKYAYIAKEMDDILEISASQITSICVRYGKIINLYKLKEDFENEIGDKTTSSASLGRK